MRDATWDRNTNSPAPQTREAGGKQPMEDAGHTEIPQAPALLRKSFNTIQEYPKHFYICMPI